MGASVADDPEMKPHRRSLQMCAWCSAASMQARVPESSALHAGVCLGLPHSG